MNNEDSYNGGEFTRREKGMSAFSGFMGLIVIGLIVVIALYATGTIKSGGDPEVVPVPVIVPNLNANANKNGGAVKGSGGGVVVGGGGPNAYVPGTCSMGDWSPWSSCNKACANADGPGTQKRIRQVNESTNANGNLCDTTPQIEVRNCNETACALDYQNVYAGADRTWDMYEGWVPSSASLGMDIPAPNDVESSGPLFQASISECQAFCNNNVDCDLIVYQPSSLAFDGSSSCTMYRRRPDATSVNMSDQAGFTTWCKEEANCKAY